MKLASPLLVALPVALLCAVAAPSAASGTAGEGGFDRDAAAAALAKVDLHKCRATNGPTGEGHVVITFSPSGPVSTVVVDRGPFLPGTPVGRCIADKFKQASVPPFKGAAVHVGKSFRLE